MFNTNKKKEHDQYAAATALMRLMQSIPNASKRQKLNESFPNMTLSPQIMNVPTESTYVKPELVTYGLPINRPVEAKVHYSNFITTNNYCMHDNQSRYEEHSNLLEESHKFVSYNPQTNSTVGTTNYSNFPQVYNSYPDNQPPQAVYNHLLVEPLHSTPYNLQTNSFVDTKSDYSNFIQSYNHSIPDNQLPQEERRNLSAEAIQGTPYNFQIKNAVATNSDYPNFIQGNNNSVPDKQLTQTGRRNLLEEAIESVEYNRILHAHFASHSIFKRTPPFDVRSSAELYRPTTQNISTLPEAVRHFTPVEDPKTFMLESISPVDHNYATASPSHSVKTATRSASTPELERPGTANTTSSDSGNSSMVEDMYPLAMHDWYPDLMKEEYTGRYQLELDGIMFRCESRKYKFMQRRMAELPTDLDYNPNKSRLRKVYDNPIEAAIRERNNLASRRSRFKKKLAQQITNMHLEFDRTENFKLLAVHDWMNEVIYELETKWLDIGATSADLRKLRQFCGFPPAYYK